MEFIKISRVDDICISSPFDRIKYIQGRLSLTTTHIIFSQLLDEREIWIEYSFIFDFARLQLSHKGIPLLIKCKNFRSLLLLFVYEQDCQRTLDTLQYFVFPTNIELLCAFSYCPQITIDYTTPNIGWNTYESQSEFARMGLPTAHWTISLVNSEFGLCETYPRYLFFPYEAVFHKLLFDSAAFRSRGRLPTLTYFNEVSGTALCRSSQPLRFISKRSLQDEELIRCIINSNPGCSYMYVVDLRPTINAIAQRAAGKGYESLDFYPNVKFIWGHIPNIHVVRESFTNFQEVLQRYDFNDSEQSQLLESCDWFTLIRKLLEVSQLCAHALVVEKSNILIHCSDGWDRTSQVSALTQILVDPFYRTIYGFVILIEKDWISFGHPFTKRCAHTRGELKEYSPIFIQFLDCIWQLTSQFPSHFEFNESLILLIANEVYRCKYGTFISESDKQRSELSLPFRTNSLWEKLYASPNLYRNPCYDHARSFNIKYLKVQTDRRHLRIWSKLYCQFCCFKHSSENLVETLASIDMQNMFLIEYITFLQRQIRLLNIHSLQSTEKLISNDLVAEKSVIIQPLNSVLHPMYYTITNEIRIKMSLPVIFHQNLSNKISCNCNDCIYFQANPRYPCLQCGSIYCLRCLSINSSLTFCTNAGILLCPRCRKLQE